MIKISTSLDIAVLLDCTLSMTFHAEAIRKILDSIFKKIHERNRRTIRLALVEFRSHADQWAARAHPFTSSMDTFRDWLADVQFDGGNIDGHKAIVDALGQTLQLNWRRNDNPKQYHEKLTILITDGHPCHLLNEECPCDSADLWKMSNEFDAQNIVLSILGIEPSVNVCDDFYCALANKTGGEYLPLINASRVLSNVIPRAIEEVHTLTQLFHRLDIRLDIELNSMYHYQAVQGRVQYMYKHCQTMSDIRRDLFTHRNQRKEFVTVVETMTDVDDYEPPSSPSSSMLYIDRWANPNINIITSSPITDDEGYRSRLLTMGSANSSFISEIGSPAFSHGSDLGRADSSDDLVF